jgi:hypothetical protein
MGKRMTLDQCGRARHFHGVKAGRYALEYTDSTHLPESVWIRLAYIDVQPIQIPVDEDELEQFYTITPNVGSLPDEKARATDSSANGSKNTESQGRVRTIKDTLALALGRVGLLTPEVPKELFEQLLQLDQQDGVVIVPDTNALHNGALHWLLRVFHRQSVWLLPVVASLTTIQTRDATVKGLVNKQAIKNLVQVLRSRGLVNGALGLLQRNRGRCQVIEIDPSLLRYQKMASGSGADPDQSDVLEDRLIIEAIHDVLRSMRSRTARRVVTSDVNVARILEAEGIETLFVPSIVLGDAPIECLRYDALARQFVGAPLRALVWELTHAFGSIRLVQDEVLFARLECYWPAKTPADWTSETLLCTFSASETAVAASGEAMRAGDETSAKPKELEVTANQVPPRASDQALESKAPIVAEPAPQKTPKRAATRSFTKINTALPRASLPQVLRLLATTRRMGGGTPEQIVAGLKGDHITVDNARRALEILRRARLLEQSGGFFRASGDAEIVAGALDREDLDLVSSIMERFDPYSAFLKIIQERGSIPRDQVIPLVKGLLGPVDTDACERLPRFHILLGQAWTNGALILDGSNRPTDRDATDAFKTAFVSTASVGIAKVRDLLPRFCESIRMSPWAARRKIEEFAAGRLLPEYTFQPAAGGKPITRDEVIKGALDSFTAEPVIIDRLHLGARPVFTIEGPAR